MTQDERAEPQPAAERAGLVEYIGHPELGTPDPDHPAYRSSPTSTEALLEKAVEVLERCRKQFDFYGQEHLKAAKYMKAQTNLDFRDMINTTLAEITKGRGEP